MQVRIFSTTAEQILEHAAREHPREACGLLLGRAGTIETAVATANLAADPEIAFEIDPAALLRAHRGARDGGPALLGWYHSHPNGHPEPSPVDAARAEEDGKLWLIATDRLRLFVSGPGPLHGRFTEVPLASIAASVARAR